MRNYKAENVDEYIAKAPKEARPHLEELRKIMKTTVPDAQEKISWGVPFYWYHGALAGFSAFKKHVGFGFGFGFAFQLHQTDRDLLEKEGYTTGKKTVQIKFDQKMPTTKIKQILKEQVRSRS